MKSFRRIVCSFYSTEAAIKVRQELDRVTFLGANSPMTMKDDENEEQERSRTDTKGHDVRARIYFGEPTPIDNTKQYLDKPDTGKLFFISPPPSPPVGWVSTREGAPNADAHASDLQSALEKLGSKIRDGSSLAHEGDERRPSQLEIQVNNAAVSKEVEPESATSKSGTRTRSGSTTVIYNPEAHATGEGKGLPAVVLEDTSRPESEDEEEGPRLDEGKKLVAHTARPPVELME